MDEVTVVREVRRVKSGEDDVCEEVSVHRNEGIKANDMS